MSDIIHQPSYRMTVYDAAGTGSLSPAPGSVHSDEFKVATSGSGVWKPYLHEVKADFGNSSLPAGTYATGKVVCKLVDFRTGTSNLERWVTAFIGSATGRNRLVGRRTLIEESLDNGATWTPFFFGRITQVQLDDPMKFSFTITDGSANIRTTIFDNIPTDYAGTSNISRMTIIPWGFENGVAGIVPAISPASATVSGNTGTQMRLKINIREFLKWSMSVPLYLQFLNNYFADLELTDMDIWSPHGLNRIDLFDTSGNFLAQGVVTNYATIANASDIIIWVAPYKQGLNNTFNVADYPIDTNLKVQVYDVSNGHEDFYLWADNAMVVLKDILDGHFSVGVTNSDVLYEQSNLDAITSSLADSAPFVSIIDEKWDAQEFIEQAILKPNLLSYYLDTSESGSVFRVFSLDFPESTAGLTTISGSHLVNEEPLQWHTETPYMFKVRSYYDFISNDMVKTIKFGQNPNSFLPTMFVVNRGTNLENVIITDTSEILGYDQEMIKDYVLNTLEIDAIGNRVIEHRAFFDEEVVTTYRSEDRLYVGSHIAIRYIDRFGTNLHNISFEVRRTADMEALKIGDWVILDVEWLPDPNTRLRGGTRLVQVVGKNTNGISITLDLLDGGTTATLATPIVSQSLVSSSWAEFQITSREDAYHRFEYIYLPSGSTSVTQTDSRWTFHDSYAITSGSTETIVFTNPPAGKRVYGRARAQRPLSGSLAIPSAWVTTSGSDIPGIPAPSGLSLITSSYYAVTASWTNGGSYETEVWSTGNEDYELQRFSVEEIGTERVTVTGLDSSPSSSNTIAIRHTDGIGGTSAWVSQSFSRGADTNQAPALGGIFVFDYTAWQ